MGIDWKGIVPFAIGALLVMAQRLMAQRPVLILPQTPQTLILDAIALAGFAALWVVVLQAWGRLPAQIPTHFGIDGRADAWGNRAWFWLLPSLGTLHIVLFTVLRRFPHTFNYLVPITPDNALQQYTIACSLLNWLKAEVLWGFAYIEWQMAQVALSGSGGLGVWFAPVFLVVIFGTIGVWVRASLTAT